MYTTAHRAQLEAALTDAINALAEEQPVDPIAFLGAQLRNMRATRRARACGAAAAVPVSERFSKWNEKGCWLLTADGTLYCGEFVDKEAKGATAHMQLVHASGVDPAEIKACGSVMAGGGFGSGARGSTYNVPANRKVMSGMDEAGLDLNSEAARAVLADLTALAGDDEKKEKDVGAEAGAEVDALFERNEYIAVGTMPVEPGSPDGNCVWMMVKGRLHCGPHEPDADGARSAHMKQCAAIGCDPSEVEFAGSVR